MDGPHFVMRKLCGIMFASSKTVRFVCETKALNYQSIS